MFQVTGVTDFEMRDLTLAGTYDINPNVYKDMGLGLSDVVDFRIYDVAFQNLARGIEIHGDPTTTRGVVYQNTFTDMYYLEPTGGALGYGVVVYGDGTWPTLALGTSQNIFIEDNTFTRNRHAVASNNGSRYVFRYNTIIDNRENAAAIDAHGKGHWWRRGSRQYEIYDNTVKNAVPRYAGVLPRGGDGVIFNNRFSSNVTYEVLLTNEGGCAGTYPLLDQIRELYIWNNTLIDSGSAGIFVQSGCKSFIQLDRDYFTTPRPGYTPYTYPHPLRAGTPTAPSNLTLTVVSSSLIQLTWTDNSANELGFKIDRWTGAAWVQIATVGANVTTFPNTGLAASTTYDYQVRAYNAAGSSAATPWQDATTLTDAVPPAAPSNLTLTVVSSRQIKLGWVDHSANELGFKIDRWTGAAWVQIATVGANVTVYSDTGLSPNTTYAYRVRACNSTGCSGYSSEVTATTLPLAFALTVAVRGSAPGTVTSAPTGISCGSSCTANFTSGTLVTLTATPGTEARFKGWSGACSGTATTCTLTLNDARSATATFSMIFTDAIASDLLPGAAPIKAAHFTELFEAINAVLPGTNLSWPSPAPAVGGPVLAVHLTTLRRALSLTTVTPGTVIAAQHINEIRLRIRAIE